MLQTVALLSGFAFAGWMIERDRRWRRLSSHALWLPAIFLSMAASRQASFWFAQLGLGGDESTRLEGSPVNVIFNGSLFLVAVLVLIGRRFSWVQFGRANKALVAIYAFFLCSMAWSPFPVSTVKRLIQDFGCVVIALIVLTEEDPGASLRVVFVRVSYILFPLSLVLLRYFPDIGRVYSEAGGSQMFGGVAGHKNLLGQMTMVLCLVLLWDLAETRKARTPSGGEPERWVRLLNLGIGLFLLVIAHSATAGICFLLGAALLFLSTRLARTKDPRRLFLAGTLAVALLLAFDQMYGASSWLSESLDRGSGLSGRNIIWRVVLEKATPSFVGVGFKAFWDSSQGEAAWREIGMGELVTAHNGYLETYLNGGVVGLFLLGAFLWATGRIATDKLVGGDPIGRMAIVFWPVLLVTNITESYFFQVGALWFTALLVLIDSPRQDRSLRDGHRPDWSRRKGVGGSRGPDAQDRPPTLASPISPRHSRPARSVEPTRAKAEAPRVASGFRTASAAVVSPFRMLTTSATRRLAVHRSMGSETSRTCYRHPSCRGFDHGLWVASTQRGAG